MNMANYPTYNIYNKMSLKNTCKINNLYFKTVLSLFQDLYEMLCAVIRGFWTTCYMKAQHEEVTKIKHKSSKLVIKPIALYNEILP